MMWRRKALAAAVCTLMSIRVLSAAAAARQPMQQAVLPKSVGTQYKAAYHYVVCQAEYVIEPANTQELAESIKAYRELAASKGAQLKIRVSRNSTSFVCPHQLPSIVDEPEDSADLVTVGIMTSKLNTTVDFDPVKNTMRIGAGMKLREFTAEATRLNMSIQVGSLPAYAGLTMAGVLSTSAHGSGYNATSNVCDTLISITWVDVQGNIRHSQRDSDEGRMFCGGIGLIGVMTELVIQMTPTTHTKLITRFLANDTDIVSDIDKMLKVSPHILVFWRPDMKLYSAYMLKAVSADVPASDAYMTLLPSYKGRINMAELFKGIQEDVFDETFRFVGAQEAVLCPTSAANSVGKSWASLGDGSDVLYAVGTTNNLAAAECWDGCAWNGPTYNGTAEDVHMSIEWDRLQDWVTDIKNIFEYDLWATEPDKGRCLGPGYLWLRFGHGGPDYMSMDYDMRKPVYIQSTWLKSRGAMDKYPMRYGFVTDLLEIISLCKYGSRPHWGKNFERTFTHPTCTIPSKYPAFQKALDLQTKHDPKGVFEPKLWKQIRDGKRYSLFPKCALTKECYCAEDSHCPIKHRCAPSKAPGLGEFKACFPDWRLVPGSGVEDISSG